MSRYHGDKKKQDLLRSARMYAHLHDPDGNVTTYTYDAVGNTIAVRESASTRRKRNSSFHSMGGLALGATPVARGPRHCGQ